MRLILCVVALLLALPGVARAQTAADANVPTTPPVSLATQTAADAIVPTTPPVTVPPTA